MNIGDKIVCCIRDTVTVDTIGSKSNGWLYTASGEAICPEVIAEPYTAKNMLAAMQERKAFSEKVDRELFEKFTQDFKPDGKPSQNHKQ